MSISSQVLLKEDLQLQFQHKLTMICTLHLYWSLYLLCIFICIWRHPVGASGFALIDNWQHRLEPNQSWNLQELSTNSYYYYLGGQRLSVLQVDQPPTARMWLWVEQRTVEYHQARVPWRFFWKGGCHHHHYHHKHQNHRHWHCNW